MAPSAVISVGRQEEATLSEFVHSVVAGGAADALTVTYANPPASLTDAMEIHVRASASNATTTPTISLVGVGSAPAYTITKLGGAALAVGDIAGNLHELILRYNLANTRWELVNPKTSNQSGSGTLGATDFTGNISLTGAEIDEAAVSIASATTTSIWAANANYLTLTGAATITSFGTSVQAGARRRIVCSSTPYLTNSANLICPGAQDIQCFAGDSFEVEDEGSNVARITSYQSGQRLSRSSCDARICQSASQLPGSMSGSGARRARSPLDRRPIPQTASSRVAPAPMSPGRRSRPRRRPASPPMR